MIGLRLSDPRAAFSLAVWAAGASWYAFVCDDAYISFRYARNLVDGHGLVFNPGLPAVEGYSNPLWVLLIAATTAIGLPAAPASMALSAVAALGVLALVARHAGRDGVSPEAAGLTLLGLAAFPPFAVWSTGGLETMAVSLSLLGVWAAAVEGRGMLAFTAGASLALLRPEGLAWAALGAFAAAARRPGARAAAMAAVVGAAMAAGAWLALRHAVYGAWLPNTVLAKAQLGPELIGRGARYLASYVASFPATLAVVAFGLWGGSGGRRWGPLLIAAAFPAEALLVGGDFMTMGRLLVPALPFAAIAAAPAVDRLLAARGGRWWALAVIGASPALVGVNLAPPPVRHALHFRHNDDAPRNEYSVWQSQARNAELWLREGRALATIAAPGDAVVSVAIGALGYASDLTVYDACGLVDPEIARRPIRSAERHSPGHDKCVPETWFIRREPEFLSVHWREVDRSPVRAVVPVGYVREVHELSVDGVDGTLTVVRRSSAR